jgi:hypothetical protein
MYNDDSMQPRNANAINVQGNTSTSVFSFSLVWYGELFLWCFFCVLMLLNKAQAWVPPLRTVFVW